MVRPPSEMLTAREAQIMEILWSHREATAETIRAELPDHPHDSSVRTLLRVLKDKGCVEIVRHTPAVYRPLISRQQVQSQATQSLLSRFFGDAADSLVMRLLEDEKLTPEQLDQLKKKLKSRRRKGEQP